MVERFVQTCAFTGPKRQELAMHNARMETTVVAASLTLLLGEATAAERKARRVEVMLDPAVFCPGRPKGGMTCTKLTAEEWSDINRRLVD